MDTPTSIFIVLAAAILWVAITSGMLALLGRAERRSGIRSPRQRAARKPSHPHGSTSPRRRRVRRGRPPRRVALRP
jgi:hypothetical protein